MNNIDANLEINPSCSELSPIHQHRSDISMEHIGECSICYMSLPVLSNHVFTVCGHLYCVKCFLKWWDMSTSCPMCRDEILSHDDSLGSNGDIDRFSSISTNDEEFFQVRPYRRDTNILHFLYADDGIEWGDACQDDSNISVPLSANEITYMRFRREWAINMIRSHIFQTQVLSVIDFNFSGECYEKFVPRSEYLQLRHNRDRMGRENFYEIVTCRREEISYGFNSLTYERLPEVNLFGYIIDIGTDLVHEDVEYYFTIEVFDPLVRVWDDLGLIIQPMLERRTILFSDIRRLYSIHDVRL
jgi:hypothetical protein